MSDNELREALLEYFDQVIAAPDDEWRRPEYLNGRRPTELFVNVGVMRSDKLRDRIDILPAELEYKLDDPDRYAYHDSSQPSWLRLFRPFDDSVDLGNVIREKSDHKIAPVFDGPDFHVRDSLPLRRVLLLGTAGQGKSAILRMAARQIALFSKDRLQLRLHSEETVPLPVFVVATALGSVPSASDPEEALRGAIGNFLRNDRCGAAADYVAQQVHERRTWLLLDRLDEVPLNQIQWALHVISGWKCRLVLASRPNALALQRIPFRETIRTYEIYQFDRDAFLDKWYSGQQTKDVMVDLLDRNRSLAEYASNPLLLTLLCSVTDSLAFQSSLTRGELLDCIVKECLGLLPRGRDNSSSDHRLDIHRPRSHQLYECFANLAWDVFAQDDVVQRIPTNILLEALQGSDRLPAVSPPNGACLTNPTQQAWALVENVEDVGFLVRTDLQCSAYEFLHRMFLEHLVAVALARRLEDKEPFTLVRDGQKQDLNEKQRWAFVDAKSWDPKWSEIIALLAGRLKDPKPLLRLLTDADKDDMNRCRLVLAGHCSLEIPQKWRAEEENEHFLQEIAYKYFESAKEFFQSNTRSLDQFAYAFPKALKKLLLYLIHRSSNDDNATSTILFLADTAVSLWKTDCHEAHQIAWVDLATWCMHNSRMSWPQVFEFRFHMRSIPKAERQAAMRVLNKGLTDKEPQVRMRAHCLAFPGSNYFHIKPTQFEGLTDPDHSLLNKSRKMLDSVVPRPLSPWMRSGPFLVLRGPSDSVKFLLSDLEKRDWQAIFAGVEPDWREAVELTFKLAPDLYENLASCAASSIGCSELPDGGPLGLGFGGADLHAQLVFRLPPADGGRRFEDRTGKVITRSVEELSHFDFEAAAEEKAGRDIPSAERSPGSPGGEQDEAEVGQSSRSGPFGMQIDTGDRVISRAVQVGTTECLETSTFNNRPVLWDLLQVFLKAEDYAATDEQLEIVWTKDQKDVPTSIRPYITELRGLLQLVGVTISPSRKGRRSLQPYPPKEDEENDSRG